MNRYVTDPNKKQNPSVVGKVRNLEGIRKDGTKINISLLVKESILRIKSKSTSQVTDKPGFRGVIIPVDDVEAMVTLSTRGVILSASQDFCLLFGYLPNEIHGMYITNFVEGNPKDIIPSFNSNSQIQKTIQCIHKDGSKFSSEISIHKAEPSKEADSALKQEILVCKIVRTSTKVQKQSDPKELIAEGQHMGVYTYGKLLGEGFFGKVQMATHKITNERVAIKTLRKKQYLAVHMEFPPREIQVLKALEHPYINQLYDTVELPDKIHLILEFVEGRELCDLIEHVELSERLCKRYFHQILIAVSYLHENDIVHRDLKLENIIIDKDNNVKLIDFGFGNFILNGNHLLRTFCGSPDYAAPELFFGKAYNGFSIDCWSLGVCLFAMLFRKFPFENSIAIMERQFVFPKNSNVSSDARDLLTKILLKDPSERLTTKQMLEHPWITSDSFNVNPPILSHAIDNEILLTMQELGLDTKTTTKSIQKRDFNQFTTTYYLLLNRKRKKQIAASLRDDSVPSPIEQLDLNSSTKKKKKDECLLL